jgi:hypothetical protein
VIYEVEGLTLKSLRVFPLAGRHRLEACRREQINIRAVVLEDWCDLELWEITENLHRAELNEIDLPIHRAKWFDLSDKLKAKKAKEVSGIKSHKLPKPGVGRGVGGGAPKGGISQAARELGVDRKTLRQDVQIAALPTAVLETAKEAGANRSALLAATVAKWAKLTGEKMDRDKIPPHPNPTRVVGANLRSRCPAASTPPFTIAA